MKIFTPFFKLLAGLLFLIPMTLSAQQHTLNELLEMMDNPDFNFYTVQKAADAYFKIHGTQKGTGYKQYKRWEENMQYMIEADGNRINPRIIHDRVRQFEAEQSRMKLSSSPSWQDLGPDYWKKTSGWNPGVGRIDAVAIDPKNQNTIYIGSPEGGCWKTTDEGKNWTSLTDGLAYMKIGHIALDPNNAGTVYIGTSGAGMLKSTDGGSTLNQISNGLASGISIRKIIVDPSNTNTVIIATSGGVYRSTNGGSSWTKINSVSTLDLEFKPGNTSTVYACGNDFYKSTDNGVTFTKISSGIARSDVMRIAVSPADPNVVCIVQCKGSTFGSFYRSTDSGSSFKETVTGNSASGTNFFGYSPNGTDNSGQGGYNIGIAISPTNANEVYIAGIIIWKSTDGGNKFTCITEWTYPNSRGYTHPDMHSVEFVGNTLYTGSDGGIYKSTDQGDNFTDLSTGLGIRMFYRLGLSKTDPEMIAVGSQDNGGSIRKSSGWIDWLGADGMEAAIHPANANIVIGSTQNGSLYKSTNGGTSQSGLKAPESKGKWTTPFIFDKNSALIAGYAQIYKSTNTGTSWTKISNFSGTTLFDHLAVSDSDVNYIYASRGATIYMTADGGTNWKDVSAGLGGATISRIAIHGSSPKKVAVATSGSKVYTSADGGVTWTNISANLPAVGTRSLIYEDGAKEGLYVGMNAGVYYRDNTMNNWVDYSTGLPKVPVNELEIQYTAKKLRAATYGRGVWQVDLYSVDPLAVDERVDENKFQICPNPASDNIQIMFENTPVKTVELSLVNVNGQAVYKQTIEKGNKSTFELNTSAYAKGIYYVRLVSENSTQVKKLILF